MRIGVIAPPWAPVPPVLYGGIELVVDELATGFQRAGHEVLLYASGDSTCPVPRAGVIDRAEGARIGHAAPELRHVLAAYETMRSFGADVVHDHTLLGPVLAAESGTAAGLTVVTTVHNQFDVELSQIYRRIARRVAIVAISHAQRRPVPDLPVARVIHHGIDASRFPVGPGDGGYCLFLGRMAADKGPHRAIEAAQKAGVPLIMCAKMRDQREFDYFDTYVKPSLGRDVQYLGEVPHQRKLDLLGGALALLFPIRWNEPFGMVMVESLACGTPVLAYPEGAAPEVVVDGSTGFLCRDETDLAEAIDRAGQIDRAACRQAVEGYFSADRMVRDHLELFERLAPGR